MSSVEALVSARAPTRVDAGWIATAWLPRPSRVSERHHSRVSERHRRNQNGWGVRPTWCEGAMLHGGQLQRRVRYLCRRPTGGGGGDRWLSSRRVVQPAERADESAVGGVVEQVEPIANAVGLREHRRCIARCERDVGPFCDVGGGRAGDADEVPTICAGHARGER